MMTGVTRINRK